MKRGPWLMTCGPCLENSAAEQWARRVRWLTRLCQITYPHESCPKATIYLIVLFFFLPCVLRLRNKDTFKMDRGVLISYI
jgi:hypothetical protein